MGQPDILVQAVVTCMEITNRHGVAPHFPVRCGYTIDVHAGTTLDDITELRKAFVQHLRDKHNMEIE